MAIDTTIPPWLLFLLGLLPLPEFFKLAIEAAYIIWANLPFFHKPKATFHLRQAARLARRTQSTAPIEQWTSTWTPKAKK